MSKLCPRAQTHARAARSSGMPHPRTAQASAFTASVSSARGYTDRVRVVCIGLALLALAGRVEAQESGVEVGAQVAIARAGAVDSADAGAGVRVAWRPSGVFGVEAELDAYPADVPERFALSRARTETLVGVTAGPTLGRWRPFVRLRPGLLRYAPAPGPIACILIFPPPQSCQVAAGQTLFVVDAGGGVEIDVTRRSYLRIDAGDRMVRYPEAAIDGLGHDFRMAAGVGVRF